MERAPRPLAEIEADLRVFDAPKTGTPGAPSHMASDELALYERLVEERAAARRALGLPEQEAGAALVYYDGGPLDGRTAARHELERDHRRLHEQQHVSEARLEGRYVDTTESRDGHPVLRWEPALV